MRSACCAAAGSRHDQRYTEPLCVLVRHILADIKTGNGAVEQCLKRIDMLARPMLAFRAGTKAAYGLMDKPLLSIDQADAEIIPVDALGARSPRKAMTAEVGPAALRRHRYRGKG